MIPDLLRRSAVLLLAIPMLYAGSAMAQIGPGPDPDPVPEENINFNYAYSAVLGAGYYSTESGSVLVGTLPLSWKPAALNERNQLKVLFPITGGIADVFNDEGKIDIEAQLLTLTFMPGIAWEFLALDNWFLVPAAQVGVARDFQQDTTAWLYSVSLRSYAWWDWRKHRFGLGNRLLGAGQTFEGSGNESGFVLLESGVEWDHLVPWRLRGQALSAGMYVLWKHYAHAANLGAFQGEQLNLTDEFRLGASFGFRESVTFFRFIPLHRVGIAIGRGNTLGGRQIKSITLNLGFPLSYE